MNTAGLSLTDAPPFRKIYPFFIASILFGIAAFAALAFADSPNRYDTYIIGCVHLFTIGFLLNAVFASLFQMLPVVGGIKIQTPKLILIAATSISIGAIFFFLHSYKTAMFVLFFALIVLLPMLILKLIKQKSQISDTAKYVSFALLGGIIALSLGFHLLSAHAFSNIQTSQIDFANKHMTISVFGFLGALIIAISRQVLPMFYVTPEFPKFCRFWSYMIFASSVAILIPYLFVAANLVIWITFLAFGVIALKKLFDRKRLMSDASLKLWQLGLSSLIIGLFLLAYGTFFDLQNKEILFGVFFGLGFLGSIVKAMINKIVPFLAWFHLTSKGLWDAPSVREMISDKASLAELYLHALAMMLFLLSIAIKPLFIVGAICAVASFTVLLYNILGVVKVYEQSSAKLMNNMPNFFMQ